MSRYTVGMGHTDVISKSLIREIVKDLATYLLGLKIRNLEDAPTEQQRIEMRHADIVMHAEGEDGSRFILHLELQNSNDPAMAQRMLRYYTDIVLSYPDEEVRQYVIYIGRAKLSMSPEIRHRDWRYCYNLIDMHELDCDRFVREDNPDALVLAVLCDFKGRDSQEVLEGIIQKLITITGDDKNRLRRYMKMLETLSVNRELLDAFREVEVKMLSQIDIEKLPSYQVGIAQGLEQGLEQGREQGLEQGILKVAVSALRRGMDIDQIAELTGLKTDELRKLEKGHKP